MIKLTLVQRATGTTQQKSVSVINHINEIKDKNHNHFNKCLDKEKAFDKILYTFMIKSLR